MGHATGNDLKETYEKCIEQLYKSDMLQISMDVPNMNWSFYSQVKQSLQNNLSSHSLHIVHGAFKKAVEAGKFAQSFVSNIEGQFCLA